ncbi:TPA: hypothetical protein ACMWN4_002175 [Clostridioides difficile]|uniref:hypothetical protein n=1 Tax=Clostridioides difficile TaxID=1496 RepID=UPI001C1D5B45|nr:hypothetical protein [Clostridioides difficile]EIS9525227.1 hypothetical protein [Clostridioides difficile]EIS9626715.1 hypothetical protein [Clostridioides difficile]KAK2237342.1 hypothetical protein XC29_18180 [Clostridioides difficile]MCE4868422.1 hypothetical protein [Clostridioides difficile]HBG1718704.1 hypothetical protein [Clostridioides difficile]
MNLNKIMNDALMELEESGFVEETVKNQLEETIKRVVNEIFGSYSKFRKNIEQHLGENINVNLAELDIQKYNLLVANVVKEKVDTTMKGQGIEHLKRNLDNMLVGLEKEYKMSELLEELKEDKYNLDEYSGDEDCITFILESSFNPKWARWIEFDEYPNKSRYNCEYSILLRNDGTIASFRYQNREISSKDIMNGFGNFGDLLFKIYAHNSKIILDCGNDADDYDLTNGEDY